MPKKDFLMHIDDMFDRRVPMMVVVALLLQAGSAVWWAATKESNDRFQQQRIENLQQTVTQTKEDEAQLMERLARIEERINAEASVLDHIEKQLGYLKSSGASQR